MKNRDVLPQETSADQSNDCAMERRVSNLTLTPEFSILEDLMSCRNESIFRTNAVIDQVAFPHDGVA